MFDAVPRLTFNLTFNVFRQNCQLRVECREQSTQRLIDDCDIYAANPSDSQLLSTNGSAILTGDLEPVNAIEGRIGPPTGRQIHQQIFRTGSI